MPEQSRIRSQRLALVSFDSIDVKPASDRLKRSGARCIVVSRRAIFYAVGLERSDRSQTSLKIIDVDTLGVFVDEQDIAGEGSLGECHAKGEEERS